MISARSVGLDFGTTNTALALADAAGEVAVVPFAGGESFRSVLHFLCPERAGRPPSIEAGPAAIARYLDAGAEGRLIQSVKSFLATRAFHETTICDQRWTLEQLVGLLLERLRRAAEAQVGDLGGRAVVGRPVHFAGPGRAGDDDVAEARLRAGLARAGFDDVTFVLEPVAAAYHYERGLDHDELVFIADFGGGTSDFSVLRVGPGARRDGAGARRVLAIDNDARAIATARKNACLNRIDHLYFRIGDVRRWRSARKFDIVTANLFSELLIEILPKLKRSLKHNGRMIFSGVLRTQERELRRTLRSQKIDIMDVRRRGKWVAILAKL